MVEAFAKRARDEEEKEERARKRVRLEGMNSVNDAPVSRHPSPAPIHTTRRSGRILRVPKLLDDFVPTNLQDLPPHVAQGFAEAAVPSPPRSRYVSPTVEDAEEEPVPLPDLFRTPPNFFGLYREYTVAPQQDPEAHASLATRCDAPTLAKEAVEPPAQTYKSIYWLTRHSALAISPVDAVGTTEPAKPANPVDPAGNAPPASSNVGPFPNKSQFRIYDWFYNASLTKSKEDLDDLIDAVTSEGFSADDLKGFRAEMAQKILDDYVHPRGIFSAEDGWTEGSVEIPLPKTGVKYVSEDAAPRFKVDGIYHRRLIPLVRAAAEDTRFAEQYHWIPHKLFWTPRTDGAAPPHGVNPIRIITDTYNADAMNDEFEKIQTRPRNPTDAADVEYVIAAILLWSDMTHLTSFGSAALWPIYMYLGNLSKYIRGMPTEFAAHHLAYIPSLLDELRDYYKEHYKMSPSADVLTFCKRELMQRIWLLLLDDEFMDAYKNGILVVCGDGVTRRIFPRIFSYSADYPEK
ncbi:hypothetical protein VTO73DRAFT_2818 [Trametes versicolor]